MLQGIQKTALAANAPGAGGNVPKAKSPALAGAGQASEKYAAYAEESGWLSEYREKNRAIALARPVRKSKYSSISKLEDLLQKPSAKIRMPKISGAEVAAIRIDEALKKNPEKIAAALSREELPKDQFGAFVNANFDSGFVLELGAECAGKKIGVDLHLEDGSCAKGIYLVAEGVEVEIVEKISGSGTALYGETAHIGDGGRLSLARLHLADAKMIDYQQCIAGKDAALVNSNAWLAGGLVRADACIVLDGKGGRAEDYSILLCGGASQFDLNYSSIHRAEGTFSHNIFNSVLRDESRCVYDGIIRIEPGGSKANALLETHSMILGEKASSNQIPQLEIKTDDVKATHSATVSKIDDDELFYMQSKGITLEDAKKMAVAGFLEGVVLRLSQGARDKIMNAIEVNI